jgi:hypothetical protein
VIAPPPREDKDIIAEPAEREEMVVAKKTVAEENLVVHRGASESATLKRRGRGNKDRRRQNAATIVLSLGMAASSETSHLGMIGRAAPNCHSH